MMPSMDSGTRNVQRLSDDAIGMEKQPYINLLDMIPQDPYEVVQGFYLLIQHCYTRTGSQECLRMVKNAQHMEWLEDALTLFPEENTTEFVTKLITSQEQPEQVMYSELAKELNNLALQIKYKKKVEAFAVCHATKPSDLLRTDNERVQIVTKHNPKKPAIPMRIVLFDNVELLRFY